MSDPTPVPPGTHPAAPTAPAGTGLFARAFAIYLKDLSLELRSRDVLAGGVVFSLLVALVMSFAIDRQAAAKSGAVGGLLWATLLMASGLTLGKSVTLEKENGCLDMLLTVPGDRAAIFLGKAAANATFMVATAALVIPTFGILFQADLLPIAPELAVIVLLGAAAIAGPGTLIGTMAGETRAREMLLPLLLFPLEIPALIAAIQATQTVMADAPLSEASLWLKLLLAFDIVFWAVAASLYDRLMEG